MFFQAVKDHLIFKPQAYNMNKAKPPFEATDYLLFYFAADEMDAQDKVCDFVLNRSGMWDCTAVSGSSASYEFMGMPRSEIAMRTLPCPCEFCFAGRYTMCTNRDIVSTYNNTTVSLRVVEAPELMQMPLGSNYTISVLKAFPES